MRRAPSARITSYNVCYTKLLRLLNHFLETMEKEYSRRLIFTPQALDSLMRYSWPGNVREMENLVERLSIMVEGEQIDVSDIPPQFFVGSKPRITSYNVCYTKLLRSPLHLRPSARASSRRPSGRPRAPKGASRCRLNARLAPPKVLFQAFACAWQVIGVAMQGRSYGPEASKA